jgi:hypothetical protein
LKRSLLTRRTPRGAIHQFFIGEGMAEKFRAVERRQTALEKADKEVTIKDQ